ncbi:MAG: 50S ribosomal protein L6 [Proteobacteria bacterium]|nr:50S ribosomal protein L6 [Pseudomonadota bacterium]NDC25219.1 50S ribosomal protein L6 [Pseudomonadota bacterium]NDD05054.1 50S ribosomal protein L6 [Pseudomonadota bacterium]
MSRVGKKPIVLPAGVKVTFNAPVVEVQGKGGHLKKTLPSSVKVEVQGNEVHIKNVSEQDTAKALHGLSRTLVQNMVIGVTEGYKKELELQGVGYRAQAQGSKLNMTLGFSHPVEFQLPAGISAQVENNTKVILKGADKELLGFIAANIRKIKPPEPYKGKGIRYLGEKISLKQGKAAGAGGGK